MLNIIDLVTPFDFDSNISYEELIKLLSYHIDNKVDGILILGECSEIYSLSIEERIELVEFVIKFVDKRMKVFVGIDGSIKDVLEFNSNICNLDFDAYVIGRNICGNESGLAKYYTYLADNIKRKIILYNNGELSYDLLQSLSYHKSIVGVLIDTKDIACIIKISKLSKENFNIYVKGDYLILPSISLGVMGIISVIGNAYPNVITDICNSTNLGESVKIFFEYEPIIKDFENEQSPTGIKYLMSLKGIISDNVRLPLGVCSKTLKRKIEEDYQNLLIKYQK